MRMFFLYLLHLQANNNASFKGLFFKSPLIPAICKSDGYLILQVQPF